MAIDFKLPELGENVSSGDVVNVLVHEGDMLSVNDGVVELETEKAIVEIPCPYAGKVAKLHVRKGDAVKVGQVLLTLEAESPAAAPATSEAATPPTAASSSPSAPPTAAEAPAGPAARRIARELGVDLQSVRGSGPRGRITPEDVQAAAASAAPSSPAPSPASDRDAWGPIRREKMPRIRRTIAVQMVRSATTIPHVTNFDDADVTELENLRREVPLGADESVRLTLMPFVLKAVALALRANPPLNASLDDQREEVVYKDYVNIGVAVDTPRGLVVPVIRDADRLRIAQLAQALAALAQRARAAAFTLDEVRGGTFTISNLGAVGGTYSTPIINHPEVAVLLLGRARWMPVAGGPQHDKLEIRLMLPLSLSYDHRLVDGAAAGRFLNEVIGLLQAPARLLLAE